MFKNCNNEKRYKIINNNNFNHSCKENLNSGMNKDKQKKIICNSEYKYIPKTLINKRNNSALIDKNENENAYIIKNDLNYNEIEKIKKILNFNDIDSGKCN